MSISLGRIRCFGFRSYLSNLSYFKKILKLGISNLLFSVIFFFFFIFPFPFLASKKSRIRASRGSSCFSCFSINTPLSKAAWISALSKRSSKKSWPPSLGISSYGWSLPVRSTALEKETPYGKGRWIGWAGPHSRQDWCDGPQNHRWASIRQQVLLP